jgi:hypothetical protein
MKWKSAAIRSVRALLQGALAVLVTFYTTIKDDGTFVNIKAHGEVLLFACFLVIVWALITFFQNLLEDNTGLNVPKG